MKKIVLIDDNPKKEAATHWLSPISQLSVIDNPDDCIPQLEKDVPDLIYLDIMLGSISGFDLLASIRCQAALSKVPVIIATGLRDIEKEEQLDTAEGVIDIISKPIIWPLLAKQAENLLNRSWDLGATEDSSFVPVLIGNKPLESISYDLALSSKEDLSNKKPTILIISCEDFDQTVDLLTWNKQNGAKMPAFCVLPPTTKPCEYTPTEQALKCFELGAVSVAHQPILAAQLDVKIKCLSNLLN